MPPGKLADIVIWNSDPLADITVLQRPSEISTIIKGHGPLTELAIAVGPRVRISFAPAASQLRTWLPPPGRREFLPSSVRVSARLQLLEL